MAILFCCAKVISVSASINAKCNEAEELHNEVGIS